MVSFASGVARAFSSVSLGLLVVAFACVAGPVGRPVLLARVPVWSGLVLLCLVLVGLAGGALARPNQQFLFSCRKNVSLCTATTCYRRCALPYNIAFNTI